MCNVNGLRDFLMLGFVELQILGTGMDTQDTSPSVLLFFDKQRFIFNAGEVMYNKCM